MQPIEFIQQHDGNLTAEQAAQLLELAEQGDTGIPLPEQGGAPGSAPAIEQQTANVPSTGNTAAPEPDPADAVILAKDGKHTIPYQKLVEAREGEQHWKAQATAAQQELEALRVQAQQRADAGVAPTAADQNLAIAEAALDQGADPDLFGDFSEEAIAKGVQTLVDQRVNAAVDARLKDVLAPYQQKQAEEASQSHYGAIYAAHPDADSIAESKELAEWIAAQPSFARAGYEAVLGNGSAQQVIELFDAFKAGAGRAQQQPAADARAVAKEAAARAKAPVPASLSDIPGGTAGPGSRFESLAQLAPADLSEAMEGWSQEQIEAFLNRNS